MNLSKLTESIIARSAGALSPVPEIDTDGSYSMFNTGGVEIEVGEFLYGLVRMIKPTRVLETGSHWGVSSSYIGQALEDNGSGQLETIEFDPANAEITTTLHRNLGLTRVTTINSKAEDYLPSGEYQFIFLDTEPSLRFAEFVRFFPYLSPGGIISIHDCHPHMNQGYEWNPFGEMPTAMKKLFKSHQLQSWHFVNHRGLYLGQKDNGFYTTGLL